jgi:hypothetical protein
VTRRFSFDRAKRPGARKARNIRITPKGYRMLAAIDRGDYIPLSTAEARSRNGKAQCKRLNKAKARKAGFRD